MEELVKLIDTLTGNPSNSISPMLSVIQNSIYIKNNNEIYIIPRYIEFLNHRITSMFLMYIKDFGLLFITNLGWITDMIRAWIMYSM